MKTSREKQQTAKNFNFDAHAIFEELDVSTFQYANIFTNHFYFRQSQHVCNKNYLFTIFLGQPLQSSHVYVECSAFPMRALHQQTFFATLLNTNSNKINKSYNFHCITTSHVRKFPRPRFAFGFCLVEFDFGVAFESRASCHNNKPRADWANPNSTNSKGPTVCIPIFDQECPKSLKFNRCATQCTPNFQVIALIHVIEFWFTIYID